MTRTCRFALLLLGACTPSLRSPSGGTPRQPAGWQLVTRYLDSVVATGAAPGSVLGVSVRGQHLYHGSGRLGVDDSTRPDSSTIYDLASLTKVIGLTSLVLLAVDEQRLALDSPVVRYVPAFGGGSPARTKVTLRHLLTHSSGLPAWRPLYQESQTRGGAFDLADTTALAAEPGDSFVYSDLGAIVLTQAVESVYGERLDSLLSRRLLQPLELRDTRYLPPAGWRDHIAPTENDPWRGRILRGEVHDENAARLDGVSGHAGLFSSARDLLRFGEWLLGSTAVTGACPPTAQASALKAPALAAEFVRRQDLPPGSSRALGWDTPSGKSSAGMLLSRDSFGHTGFTGTSVWIDPHRCLALVLLSNLVHPSRDNPRWGPVRGAVADLVAQALDTGFITH